jgi:Na+/H+ antiporter NhaD/arsenite permease-like protein
MAGQFWIGLGIVFLTLVGVSVGRFPYLRMNRATIAFVGATALILSGAINLETAYQAIDMNTIVLLLSIMILNANFRLSGFFYLVSQYLLKLSRTPRRLLLMLILFSGTLSALFLNDTIVLVFTPIVLEIALTLRRNPLPYLIALATSANIGSVATIIGNPQNILIGIFSGIPFLRFTAVLLPVAMVGMGLIWLVIVAIYRREFAAITFETVALPRMRIFRPLLLKCLISTALMLLMLVVGMPTALAATTAASFLLITRRLKPERVFAEVDWSLLVFFAGLFVVTKSIETIGFSESLISVLQFHSGNELLDLSLLSAVASNIVSNVPAVLLLQHIISNYANAEAAWLTMAMATTFAGNFTLIGSVANLIVAESAKNRGVELTFGEYFRAGAIITVLSIAVGVVWLSAVA